MAVRVLCPPATQLADTQYNGAVGALQRCVGASSSARSRSLIKYADEERRSRFRGASMEYEGQIKINVHGTTQWVWVYVRAQSVEFARALLQAQYGRQNVLNVQQQRKG